MTPTMPPSNPPAPDGRPTAETTRIARPRPLAEFGLAYRAAAPINTTIPAAIPIHDHNTPRP